MQKLGASIVRHLCLTPFHLQDAQLFFVEGPMFSEARNVSVAKLLLI